MLSFQLACDGGGSKDTDGDGMPDDWEIEHGTDPTVDDAGLDYDHDGLTNLEEYLAGTDPLAAEAPPELCNGLDDDEDGSVDEDWTDKGAPCGFCGSYTCAESGQALFCQGPGVCSPGTNRLCQTNGMQTCLDTCEWGECIENSLCTPGETDISACGYCDEGTQSRLCFEGGIWGSWGECVGEGCRPGEREACVEGTQAGIRTCDGTCVWGECVPTCTPGEISVRSCGDCGGTQYRTCRSDGTWGDWRRCTCDDQTETVEDEVVGTQTRICSYNTWCLWTDWTNCESEAAECDQGDIETEPCGCGGNGLLTRTCSDYCNWSEWSDCEGDFDATPPTAPVLLAPESMISFGSLPVAFSWTAAADNCALSLEDAYELMFVNSEYMMPASDVISVMTSELSCELGVLPGGQWSWVVRARDQSGNWSGWTMGRYFTFAPQKLFQEDFEGFFPGVTWSVSDAEAAGGEDYWGLDGRQVRGGEYAGWCAAEGEQSDDECGPAGSTNTTLDRYDNNMDTIMEISTDTGSMVGLVLSWWYWLEAADAGDCLSVQIRQGTGDWTVPWEDCTGPWLDDWSFQYLDVSEYAGKSDVSVQFRFTSDAAGHCAEGAYLDDIVLEGWR